MVSNKALKLAAAMFGFGKDSQLLDICLMEAAHSFVSQYLVMSQIYFIDRP